jgi:hypothetical protein
MILEMGFFEGFKSASSQFIQKIIGVFPDHNQVRDLPLSSAGLTMPCELGQIPPKLGPPKTSLDSRELGVALLRHTHRNSNLKAARTTPITNF